MNHSILSYYCQLFVTLSDMLKLNVMFGLVSTLVRTVEVVLQTKTLAKQAHIATANGLSSQLHSPPSHRITRVKLHLLRTVHVHQMKAPIPSKKKNNNKHDDDDNNMCMRVVKNLFHVNTILHIKLNVPSR